MDYTGLQITVVKVAKVWVGKNSPSHLQMLNVSKAAYCVVTKFAESQGITP